MQMRTPVWLKPGIWGAVIGAVGIMIVGFSWMGWTLNSTTQRVAAERTDLAVTAALTPFCVSSYMTQPDADKQLALLREETSSYSRRETIEKGGWATMPGSTEPSPGVANACAVALLDTKTVGLVK
jgi:hypothetical protein